MIEVRIFGPDKSYTVIVNDELSPEENENKLLNLLKRHNKVIGYSINDLKGLSPAFCTHRIPMEDQCNPMVDHQRRLTHDMRELVKEVIKLLDARIIYSVPHSEWVSLVHCEPKKGGLIVVKNEKNNLDHPHRSPPSPAPSFSRRLFQEKCLQRGTGKPRHSPGGLRFL
jgi:hypothetical protein